MNSRSNALYVFPVSIFRSSDKKLNEFPTTGHHRKKKSEEIQTELYRFQH